MKLDFKDTLRTPAYSFSVSGGLPKNGKWRTKIPSGGLLKNGKWRTKVLSGGLLKNGKQRTKVPSGGLPKNGKWRTKVLGFLGVFRKMEKTKIRKYESLILGGFLKNGKRKQILTDWIWDHSVIWNFEGPRRDWILFRRFILEINFYLVFNILYRFKIAIDIILIS
ncbi:hypothetical protein RIR_jg21145.t1 [Rhizophagus irregularis DAOM 181602=DAOM 197198]|nr:hypothetical protein RIR_jg21145.t1 [Rhizophagus irregularis DAOM 181602=DAOM 197198]